MSREISQGTKEYADNVLGSIQTALEDALKVIQNNRKELKINWKSEVGMYFFTR